MKGREVVATETRKQKQKLSGARGEENRLRAEGKGATWPGRALRPGIPLRLTPLAGRSGRATWLLPSLDMRCLVPE